MCLDAPLKKVVSSMSFASFSPRPLLLTASALLSACGGGFAGNTGGGGLGPGQPTQNQDLSNLVVSQSFETASVAIVGNLAVGTGTPTSFSTAQADFGTQVQLDYDAGDDSYTVSINQGGISRTETFGPGDIDAAASSNVFTGYTRGDQIFALLRPDNPTQPLSFVGYGAWQESTTQGASVLFQTAFFTYGILTAANDIPRQDSAQYSGFVDGFWNPGDGLHVLSGTANFDANFGNNLISGTLVMSGESITDASVRAFGTFDAVGTISASENEFSGTLQNRVSATNTGFFDGAFFGPNAEELGGSFRLTGFGEAAGVFVGASN
ncbi:MAG: transferrin-binding protein-like solute binding protein [Pseudomonadota bacterium]